ncbi:hypothetical protein BP6252_03488 [Coleophoma cylindrospora]|uniref:FAD-binding domain-containing protein n=1 Tax=Coleophoma cylindrospora TaxID=1849047 RepID=A0A3D8S7U9_9HELO|nr:hypothetical protein BP6252_03488 [Coleophoma cylindrospora]
MSVHSMRRPHVVVIGAGLGGLVLAQALRKRNITFQIFERDSNDAARFQGWALSLHSWLKSDLLESTMDNLPPLETLGTTYNINLPAEGAIFDQDMNEKWRLKSTPETPFIRADRAKLRQWLLTNIKVVWDRKFTYYQERDDGVIAFFDDGSSVKGDILIGADGIGSKVRQQLLPEIGPKHLPMGVIVGQLTATQAQYQKWMKAATSFYVGFSQGRRVFVGLKSIADDKKSAEYYWIFGWHDKAAEEPSYWTTTASKETLHVYVMNHLDGLDTSFTEPICATTVEGILHPPLQMRDMVPPTLPKGRVSLLGDAVHPMVPFRGEGGNMAMKDGMSLARTLEQCTEQNIEDALKSYEAEMSERATKSVLDSRAGAQD